MSDVTLVFVYAKLDGSGRQSGIEHPCSARRISGLASRWNSSEPTQSQAKFESTDKLGRAALWASHDDTSMFLHGMFSQFGSCLLQRVEAYPQILLAKFTRKVVHTDLLGAYFRIP